MANPKFGFVFLAPGLYSHNCSLSLSIFAKRKSEATKTSIAVRILLKDRDSSGICSDVPFNADRNVEFIVNTNCLLHWKDIHCNQSGFVRTKTKKYYNDFKSQDLDNNQSKHHDLTVTRYISVHFYPKDFHKITVSISLKDDKQPMNLVYIRSYFDDKEHELNFNRIHGNPYGTTNWRETKFLVKQKIMSLSREGVTGKWIFQSISKSAAGFEGGLSGAEFPVSMTQIYDISRKDNKKMKIAD